MGDLTFALRTLRRRPGFTAAIVLTLALGIGATTAVFTVLDAVALRPLPFARSERAVQLAEVNPELGQTETASPPNVDDWARSSRAIPIMGLARSWSFVLGQQGRTLVRGAVATPGWFQVHALEPALGRGFVDGDLARGANRVAVVSHDFWTRELGGDAAAVGRGVTLDGERFEIIGVLPPRPWIHLFAAAEVWVPLTAIPDDVTDRGWRGFVAVGRLAEGATLAGARAEFARIRDGLAAAHPRTNADWDVRIEPLRARVAAPLRNALWLFVAAVALVLLVGCVNVANLMLVRAGERARELAVRASLGAGRGRLARLLLVEAALLATVGALLGLGLATWGIELFVALAPRDLPRVGEVRLDARALAFTVGLTALTALLFGAGPALRASRPDLDATLRGGGAWGTAQDGGRLRRALVVAQAALAVTLLGGAALMTRGFHRLAAWDPGFDRGHLAVAWALAPDEAHADPAALFERAAEALRGLPDVAAVGLVSAGPLFGGEETAPLGLPGAPPGPPPGVRWYDVAPGAFAALGVPLVAGRDLRASDGPGAPPVALVNQTLAARLLGGDALGRRVVVHGRTLEIVGVVRDVPPPRPGQPTPPEIYWPQRQAPRLASYVVLRTRAPAAERLAALDRAVRARLAEAAPGLQLASLTPLAELEAQARVAPRFTVLLMAAFAAIAVLLATLGVYGVIARAVVARRRELAIRLAVGARPAALVRRVVLEGLRLTLAGLALGVAATLLLARLVTRFLYGVPPGDPATLAAIAALFTAVAGLACLIPAMQAGRVDPMTILRQD